MRVPDSDLSLQLEDEATAERSAVTSENILGTKLFQAESSTRGPRLPCCCRQLDRDLHYITMQDVGTVTSVPLM